MSRPPSALAGRSVLLVGLGRFGGGLGAALWLLDQGARLTITDRSPAEDLAPSLAALEGREVRTVLGTHEGLDPSDFDLLVVNPAVPPEAPLVRAAEEAGVAVTTEMGLLLERWPGSVLGVTGSNGKSTTVTLAAALVSALGLEVALGGNLGGSLLTRLADAGPETVAVVELSSFMLARLLPLGLGPDVAVVTNLTPNHLDWHGTSRAYAEAKAAILVRAHTAILPPADDPAGALLELCPRRGPPPRVLRFGLAGSSPSVALDLAVAPDPGDLVDADGLVLPSAALPLPGLMNRLDLAAAILAVEALPGVGGRLRPLLAGALGSVRAPPHRLQTVSKRGDVRWIDDSVSTTPESTAASLRALKGSCLLIAGGRDKGLDARPLLEAAREVARIVLTVGEQGLFLAEALNREGIPAEHVKTVSAAVHRAAQLARPGEAVLLSPGYSSHDQFSSFEARARTFTHAVESLGPVGELSWSPREC